MNNEILIELGDVSKDTLGCVGGNIEFGVPQNKHDDVDEPPCP